MNSELAPIVLFVYNRPNHTRKTLTALSENSLASKSKLFIFCDGLVENADLELKQNSADVKKIIREKEWCGEVVIYESTTNQGLAKSVIKGVTKIINKYGKIIVLEDDLIVGKNFLEFMNNALNKYESESRVSQISGFCFGPPHMVKRNSCYFLPLATTWGWGTWKRVWEDIDFNCSDYLLLKNNKELTFKFNFCGSYNYKKMLFRQMQSEFVSSWGVRFYWNIFKMDKIVLYPDQSLVRNIGWDSTGTHRDNYEIFPITNWEDDYAIQEYPDIELLEENKKIIAKYIKLRTSYLMKILHYSSRIFPFFHMVLPSRKNNNTIINNINKY